MLLCRMGIALLDLVWSLYDIILAVNPGQLLKKNYSYPARLSIPKGE